MASNDRPSVGDYRGPQVTKNQDRWKGKLPADHPWRVYERTMKAKYGVVFR